MASSGNFCTYSPRNVQGPAGPGSYVSATKGNLGGTTTSGSTSWVGTTFGLPSGKWYFEAKSNGSTSGWPRVGFYSMGAGGDSISSVTSETSNNLSSLRLVHNSGCGVEPFGSTSVTEITGSVSSGDIVQIAIDVDAGKIWYGVNNTYLASGNPATGANAIDDYTAATYNPVMPCVGTYNSQALPDLNFGQDSSFAGAKTAQGNTDGNGFGDFYYAPPTGFLALCTANLPISDDIDPAQTDDNYPTKNFGIVKYTGTGSSQAITGLGFKPDLIWIKQRNGSGHNVLTDSTRGVTKQLEITDTEGDTGPAESTNTDGVTAIGTDGFTVGGDAEYSGNTNTYVAWCWRAGEGTTATNTDGTVASTVQANTAAGFSIVSYTGTGSAMTIGHGLSSAPNFTIIKDRSNATNWIAFYDVEDGSLDYMFPNAYTGKANSGLTGPNSSIWNFSASDSYSNTSSRNYIMYAWHNVEGYQRFGTYEGNNIDNNGPFVYTGFRPRLLVIKGIDESYGWYVFDSERSTSNLVDDMVSWFPGGSETSEPTGARKVDFLSNGFKVMADAASINGASDTYLYMAWGDTPFKYNNTF